MRKTILTLLAIGLAAGARAADDNLPLDSIKLPAGFQIAVYASGVRNARSMALGAKGTVFVGTRTLGTVYALVDADHDGRAEQVYTLATGLHTPNGVAFKDGALYVAEVSRILRYDNIEDHLKDPPKPVVVTADYPTATHHGWKFIAFGPDGLLYVPVGAPCNICLSDDPYASITRIKPDGSGREIVARGVRNTVGFDWHPQTKELWFTENGRDYLGDDSPPDELNRVGRVGQHFGYPYCHGGDIQDGEFKQRPCSEFVAPERKLDPHVAAIGMRFYNGTLFPPEYRGQILFAEHGSWNRSHKIGYRVMMVRLKDGKAVSYEPFAEGWLQGERNWGRPADVQVLPDGSMLVSDDQANVVYRITHGRPAGK
jgi:glucose/arabinose dehydrogenase